MFARKWNTKHWGVLKLTQVQKIYGRLYDALHSYVNFDVSLHLNCKDNVAGKKNVSFISTNPDIFEIDKNL